MTMPASALPGEEALLLGEGAIAVQQRTPRRDRFSGQCDVGVGVGEAVGCARRPRATAMRTAAAGDAPLLITLLGDHHLYAAVLGAVLLGRVRGDRLFLAIALGGHA
jgi:hypothetical protein